MAMSSGSPRLCSYTQRRERMLANRLHPGKGNKGAKKWGDKVASALLDGEPAGSINANALAKKARGKELAPVSVFVNGTKYVRSHRFGNKSAEAVVRRNLERFILDTQATVKQLLKDGKIGSEFPGQKNTILDVELFISDFQLKAGDYFTGAGKPMKLGKSFRYAIRQFFLDADFAWKVCRQAVKEYNEELRRSGRQDDIVV